MSKQKKRKETPYLLYVTYGLAGAVPALARRMEQHMGDDDDDEN